jgi:hypothetical protein
MARTANLVLSVGAVSFVLKKIYFKGQALLALVAPDGQDELLRCVLRFALKSFCPFVLVS